MTFKYFPYFYKITVDRVIDGDTIVADFDLGFNITLKVTVRMAGYDAPEISRPLTEAERAAGYHTTTQLAHLLTEYYGNFDLYCRSTKIDLYGRSTGIVYYKNDLGEYCSINDLMAQWIKDVHYTKKELRA